MTSLRNLILLGLATMALGISALAPAQSAAEIKQRQKTKNQWRNAATAAGTVGAYGLLKGDGTLTFLGTAGALYSANRYEQDRKSQSKTQRQRAETFSKGYFYKNGHKYVKKTIYKNGKKYYRFVRAGK
jgi:hypothetical protein